MTSLAVVIPAHNAQATVGASIRSALGAGAVKVVVVDDGSVDRTAEVAEASGAIVIAQANAGAMAARLAGFARVQEAFTVFLDADDLLLPDGVEASLKHLGATPEAIGACGTVVGVDSSGAHRRMRPWPEGITLGRLIERRHGPGPPAMFMWRTVLLRASMAGEPAMVSPRYAEDYELLLRASRHGAIVQHGHEVCIYRWGDGKSALSPEASIRSAESLRLYYARDAGISVSEANGRQIRAMVARRRASGLLGRQSRVERFALMAFAVICDPSYAARALRRRLRAVAHRRREL